MKKIFKGMLLGGACVAFFLFFRKTEPGRKMLQQSGLDDE